MSTSIFNGIRASKVYIAGPMRGRPLHNFPAFFEAAMVLRSMGYDVCNPAEVDMANGYDPSKEPEDQPPSSEGACFEIDELLRDDAKLILDCDAVVFLAGWETSEGARFERMLAHYTGRKIINYEDAVAGRWDLTAPTRHGVPHLVFPEDAAVAPAPEAPQRLWATLPGVKQLRLTLMDAVESLPCDGMFNGEPAEATVRVDVLDSETGEILYDFGKMTLKSENHQTLIKLDAEVETYSPEEIGSRMAEAVNNGSLGVGS